MAGAVIDQVELGIVGEPAPNRAAAALPCLRRPSGDPEVMAPVAGVEWLERGPDEHVLVRTGAVRLPDQSTGIDIERRNPTAHAIVAAGISDQNFVFDDERRHGPSLAD